MADVTQRLKRNSLGLEGLVSIFMTAAALGPMMLLLAAGAPLFAQQDGEHTFEYWGLLIVLLVLGTAFLFARVFSSVLARHMRPLVEAAAEIAPGDKTVLPSNTETSGSLSEKFDQIETVLFESRRVAVGRMKDLEQEAARLRLAAQAQTRFFSEAAHEIRTPLSAIISAARIIQRYHEKTPDVVDRFGSTIISEGNRLVKLISDMSDLVKIEAGVLKWEEEELRPAAIVGDAVSSMEEQINEQQLQLHVEVSERLPVFWGDRKRLVQVLVNLLRNAVKFTPAHGRIEILAREAEAGVQFTVRDTGVGIPPEMIPRLFESGSLLPGRKQCEQGGAGLGLALCRNIIAHYSGRIWAKNGARCGAEIHFLLPALAVGFVPKLVETPERAPLRVLLLMKNSVLADCAVRALRLDDIDSRVCARLQDVFMVIATWTPDVIVVSPSFAWQLTDTVQQRIRKLGVSHIMMFSQTEGFVEVSPPTHMEPLLVAVGRLARNGSCVLLVDDDPEYGSVIEFELSQAGYAVDRAYNGVDAVSAATERRPAVLVLDLALPQLDGFGVLAQLREREVPVATIVLTALDDSTVEARLRDEGAVEVFRKFELILASGAKEAARVREILTPVLAANPSEVSREAGLLANGNGNA